MTLISELFLNKYRYFTATPSITHEYNIFVQYMTGIANQQDNPAQKDIRGQRTVFVSNSNSYPGAPTYF